MLTITNSGSESISFNGSNDGRLCGAPDGIDILLYFGGGESDLCTKENMDLVQITSQTENWSAASQTVPSTVSAYMWTISPHNATFLASGEFIKIKIGSVNTNGTPGAVTIKLMLHTSKVSCDFSANLQKVNPPEIIKLSAKVTNGLNGSKFIPLQTVLGSESEGYTAMPYVNPPPEPRPPKPKRMVSVEWETENAESCSIKCGSDTYSQIDVSGSTVLSIGGYITSVTLTAYSEYKPVSTEKTVSIEE